jgi:hypothetical protein
MSLAKKDRNFRSDSRSYFRNPHRLTSVGFSKAVSGALHREYGRTHAAVKTVVSVTEANQRAVKNWFDAKNAPRGHHLIELLRHSDCVLEMVLEASGRRDILLGKKLVDSRAALVRMVALIDELSSI